METFLTAECDTVGGCISGSCGTIGVPDHILTITEGCTNIQTSIPSGFRLKDLDFPTDSACNLVFSINTDCSTFDAVIEPNDQQCFTAEGFEPTDGSPDTTVQLGGNAFLFCF
jgi:hypothetical protein